MTGERVPRTTTWTTTPPARPPTIACPECNGLLTYEESYLGGTTSTEQWDRYRCPAHCGTFIHRHRTGRLRRLEGDETASGFDRRR